MMKFKVCAVLMIISLVICLAGPAISANSSPVIEKIQIEKSKDNLEIFVNCDKPVEYKVHNMTDPYVCLIIDIFPAQLSKNSKINAKVDCGGIKHIRTGQFSDNPDIVRLVIDLEKPVKYKVNTIRAGSVLALNLNYCYEAALAAKPAEPVKPVELVKPAVVAAKPAEPVKPVELVKPAVVAAKPVEPVIQTMQQSAPAKTLAAGACAQTANKTEQVNKVSPVLKTDNSKQNNVQEIYANAAVLTALKGFLNNTATGVVETKSSGAIKIKPVVIETKTTPSNLKTLDIVKPAVVEVKPAEPVKPVTVAVKPAVVEVKPAEPVKPVTVAVKPAVVEVKPAEPVKNTVINTTIARQTTKENIINDYFAYKPAKQEKTKEKKTVEKEQTFNVDYQNEDILFILKELAKKTGKNIITDGKVSGTITVSLKQVTLDRALQVILKTAGFGYKKIDNIIIVAKPENLAKISPVSIKKGFGSDRIAVIPISFSQAEDIKKSIQGIIPDLDIVIDKRLNALVISASEEEVKSVKNLVEQFDQLPSLSSDPNSVTKVVKLKYGKAKDVQALITKWYPQVSLVTDERINGFIVKDNKDNIEKLEKFISKVDAPKRQVLFDVKIVDVTETGKKSLGVTWNSNGNLFSTTFQEVRNTGAAWEDVDNGYGNWPPLKKPTYQDLPFTGFGRTPLSFPMTINYLITKGEAKVLASPQVLTLSGEKASVSSGQHYPIVYSDPRAGGNQAEYIDIAIKVELTPQITPDGYIMVEVAPEISDEAASKLGSQYIETITRSLKTNVIVKEGETIILGGLYRNSLTTSRYKRPLFGDMPFLGEFFKNSSEDLTRDEVLIMVTPKLVNPEV